MYHIMMKLHGIGSKEHWQLLIEAIQGLSVLYNGKLDPHMCYIIYSQIFLTIMLKKLRFILNKCLAMRIIMIHNHFWNRYGELQSWELWKKKEKENLTIFLSFHIMME